MTGERRQVREGVYAELADATTIPENNIRNENPAAIEQLPAIAHRFATRNVPMNIATSPSDVVTDSNGDVTAYVYKTVKDLVFSFTSVAETESKRETIYDNIIQRFTEYVKPIRDVADIHSSVTSVFVDDVTPFVDTNRDPRSRGDSVTVRIRFTESVTRDVTAVQSVDTVLASDQLYGLGTGELGSMALGSTQELNEEEFSTT
jgi:hypothetical protein